MLRKLVIAVFLLLLAAAFSLRLTVPSGHAAATQGEVCIAPSTQTLTPRACPSFPPVFSGAVGGTLDVNVNYGGPATAGGFNTFDISVFVDSSVLSAPTTSAGVTVDSLFPIVAEICINGIIVTATCSPTDVPGVVHVVAAGFNFVNNNQTLLTIHYSIAG